ncbi:MAG: transcription elongation factor GreA [Clostridia bacterium]|nr:transcription elongation factor GreA [Clostridia bacterium]
MEKKTVLTSEGLKKLKEELTALKTVGRKEIADKIKTARGYGDLSENSEYDEAKNEQAKLEARIMELEATLADVTVVDAKDIDHDRVAIGTHVRVLDVEFDEEMELWIVGASEAEPSKNRLSDESPVGASLIGKKVGETAEAEVPSGDVLKFKVLEIYQD